MISRPEVLQTTIFFRNGSIGLIDDTNGNFTWIQPPKSYFVDYHIVKNADGSKDTFYANGTIIKDDYPPLGPDASDTEKIWAVNKIIVYGNGTDVWYFRNGTVAVYDEGLFTRYIVPPSSYFVSITILNNDDGSYTRQFSNGTWQYFAAPPTGNETAEMKAFRINRINSEPDGIQTFYYANGTVAVFNGTDFVKYIVAPTSYFVTRQVTIFNDGGFLE